MFIREDLRRSRINIVNVHHVYILKPTRQQQCQTTSLKFLQYSAVSVYGTIKVHFLRRAIQSETIVEEPYRRMPSLFIKS